MDQNLLNEIDQKIENNSNDQINFVQKMIQTNSSNPFTAEKSKPETPIEKEMANLVFNKLKSFKLDANYQGVSPYRPNVICKINGTIGEKTLILNGHMDTVLPSSECQFDPFAGIIQNNRLYGLGAIDMKSSLSVFIYAIKAIRDCGVQLKGNLVMTFVVDEEPGACSKFGTQFLLKNGLKGDAAIVAEPGNRNIAIGHRGGYRFKITTFGKAVHTGFLSWERNIKGQNAIIDMMKIINKTSDISLPYTESEAFPNRKPVITFPTLIEGGTSINIVPEQCFAYGDCRLLPGCDDKEIEKILYNSLDEIGDIEYSLEKILFVPPVEIPKKSEIVDVIQKWTTNVIGKESSVGGVGPWNDGWMFITRGIPAICGFGPNGKGVHSPDEFVLIDSLIETTKIYARVIMDYLGID